ncbi:MAG: 2-hydroxyacyl-CoA dehydratase subunit D, partial [Thermodesulfobacteriota bacterium]
MKAMQVFESVSEDPTGYIRKTKNETGKPVLGYFCSYTPEEIIHAAGAVPFRLFGTKGDIRLADAHLQSYCCSLVRGGLEDALNGTLSFLDGTVFVHTCDSIQRLSDIWRINAGFPVHIDAVMPVKLDSRSARDYMVEVLSKCRTDMETALGVQITDEALWRSIETFNRIRRQLRTVYEMHSRKPEALSPAGIYQVMRSAMVMDRDVLPELLDEFIDALGAAKASGKTGLRKRVILSGGICNHPDIYGVLADAGGDVVWDDLCTGTRYMQGDIDTSAASSPVEAIADRFMNRRVCPAKHMDNTGRGRDLLDAVYRQPIDGVVFLLLKFCDPHAFDYPYLKQFLDNAGIA